MFACICLSVCLSICLLAGLLKNACMDLDEMLRVDRCQDMDELINFEPDPDYSPDAMLCGILRRENPTYTYAARHGFKMVLRPTATATRGFTMVLFTEAVSR